MTTSLDPFPEFLPAAEANRSFSRLLREVQSGRSFVVTSHGRPVARVSPFEAVTSDLRSERRAFFDELRKRPAGRAGAWTRDELHED